ncbi:thiamine phosphate synthase [Niallia sp. XMNu-256]|uniref:thiamine phosphate synthase n=1 Tax=Niallia sp. XMNu-256 TaxID=3082444 RepID=UPI0030CE6F31
MKLASKYDVKNALKVYFIMGSNNCNGRCPKEVLFQAIEGGITMFQFREKGEGSLKGIEKIKLAEELQMICQQANIPFIVNDDIELALLLNADGVHIGQEDEPAQNVREKLRDKIVGISVHNIQEAKQAIKNGADYFGVGPIFPTVTKKDTNKVQGIRIISELRKNGIHIPLVGIGGITTENASSVIKAGADGISIITAISHAENVELAAKKLSESVGI